MTQSKLISIVTMWSKINELSRQYVLGRMLTDEARSGSMDPALITPEYIFRMWGGKVPLEEIREAMKLL